MSVELKTLIEDGNKTIAQIRSDVDALKGKSDPISAEKVAKMEADLASTLTAKSALETEMKALEERLAEVETKANRPGTAANGEAVDEHKQALIAFLRAPEDAKAVANLTEWSRKSADFNTLTGTAGGLAVPKVVAAEIIRLAALRSPIRAISRTITVGTTDYSELVDQGGAGSEWVGEGDTRNKTNTPDIGEVRPTFGMLAAKPEATIEALQDAFFDAETWIRESVIAEFARAEGAAFVAGNGVKKPTGFLAAPQSADIDGVRAGGALQTINTGAAGGYGEHAFDAMIDLVFALRSEYRANARWVMNSGSLAAAAKVKNLNGDYILQPAVTAGMADRVMGYSVTVAEDMPNLAADATPVAFGDFSRGYLIADRAGLTILRDPLTRPGYVRFQIFRRVGGCVRDSQAIKLLKVSV